MYACSIDGKLTRPENATISVLDHGLLYGDGIFEGLRFYNSRIFRLQDHMDRLEDSALALSIDMPMSQQAMVDSLESTMLASGLDDGYIRLLVTRGTGPMGVDPTSCIDPKTVIIVDKLAVVPQEAKERGAKLIIASLRRLSPDQLDPRIKSMNYLNQVMAKQEAVTAGADEAIILNQAGRVAEGSADNVFIVKKGVLLTPPTIEGALDGITRKVIMELATGAGIEVKETPLTVYDLKTADECFLTGTGAELIPVSEIQTTVLPAERPYYEMLEKLFQQAVYAGDENQEIAC